MIDITYGLLHYNPLCNEVARSNFHKTLISLYRNRSNNFKNEVFVIDQGNPKEEIDSYNYLCSKMGFNLITLKKNIGISRGINFIFNLARGDFISLVTSDVIFPKNIDNILIQELEKDKTIWQICPLSDNSEIPYQKIKVQNKNPIKCIAKELTIEYWSRSAINNVGFFCENFFATHENMDFALRLFIAGGFAAISPRIKCEHYHAGTIKSGAREHGCIDQSALRIIWDQKWAGLNWDFMYRPEMLTEENRLILENRFSNNIYLPYIQDVNY